MMTNLLEETKDDIVGWKHTLAQVAWVGSRNGRYAVSWESFVKIANIEYHSGYGSQEVAHDLVVVFTDGSWMERHEYDGSESWTYNKTPIRRTDSKPFSRVKSDKTGASIHDMNRPGRKWGER
jgi:hypothetical protein